MKKWILVVLGLIISVGLVIKDTYPLNWDYLSLKDNEVVMIGEWTFYPIWSGNGNYDLGDIVRYEGRLYIAIKPHIPNVIAPDSHVAWVFWEELK